MRLFAALILFGAVPVVSAPPLWVGLQPGPYAVAFQRVVIDTPASRHPLPLWEWYPAAKGGRPMTYRDYVDDPDGFERFLTNNGLSKESVRGMLAEKVYACRGAHRAKGDFPLVLIAQGNGQQPGAQAVLAEFLASHGYHVAAIPSIMRLTGALTADAQVAGKMAAEAADLDLAAGALRKTPAAIVGHSFGARSALLYAMAHPVKGVVSLDGGIGAPNLGSLLPDKPLPAVLHLYERNDERIGREFAFVRAHAAHLDLVELKSLQHVHFTSDGFLAARYAGLAKATHATEGLRDDVTALARQTLDFVDRLRF